jgi:hypothetical protein
MNTVVNMNTKRYQSTKVSFVSRSNSVRWSNQVNAFEKNIGFFSLDQVMPIDNQQYRTPIKHHIPSDKRSSWFIPSVVSGNGKSSSSHFSG